MRALLISAAVLAATQAWAQDDPVVVEGDLVVTTGLTDDDAVADVDARLTVTGSAQALPGLEVGGSAGVRVDSDQADRFPVAGRYSSLTAGGSRGFGEGSDIFLDRAYLFARGAFGGVTVGAHEGAAAKLAVTSPTIFRALGVNDWRSDPSGRNDVHTVNDFSGNAAKITYMPPSGFLGGLVGNVQLGVSYTPELDTCTDNTCAPVGGFAVATSGNVIPQDQKWSDVSEAALYYQNGFSVGGERVILGLGASYVQAEEEQVGSFVEEDFLEDYKALALGLNLAYGDITIGGSVKSTNAGLDEQALGGPSDYLAFDAGITYTAGDWKMMLGYGQADAERDAQLLVGPQVDVTVPFALDRRTQTAQAGVAYVLGRGITLGAAAQYVDSNRPDPFGGDEDTAAVMIESSIRF